MNGPKQGASEQAAEQEALLKLVFVRTVGFATYLGCGNDAEDVAQETMQLLHTKYADVTDSAAMSKLASTICAKLAMNWRRRMGNPAKAVELPLGLPDLSRQDPEAAMSASELKTFLLKAIEESGPNCKEIVRLRVAGFNSKEIAARMSMKVSAVDTAYFRCIQRLRGALGARK